MHPVINSLVLIVSPQRHNASAQQQQEMSTYPVAVGDVHLASQELC